MRKVILMMLLAIVSSNAAAEWVLVGSSKDGMTVYADTNRILKAGNKIKMWRLFDFNSTQKANGVSAYMSNMGLDEYDCKEILSRTIAFYFYSDNMGHGEVVYSNTDTNKLNPVLPDSIGETLWKFACKKR